MNANDDAAAVSERLRETVVREIREAGGWIPFARFMELALYAPGLGYYSAGAKKVGRDPRDGSDFTTAPESTPLFGRALAHAVGDLLDGSDGTIVELGGGSGRLAADILTELEANDALPNRYTLLDLSADFRARQHDTLRDRVPHLLDRIAWIDTLPDRIGGVVLGNEVLDAIPVPLVVRRVGRWLERGVVVEGEGFSFADRPANATTRSALASTILERGDWPEGFTSEVHPQANALVASLTERLTADGSLLLIDYGFPESEYYHRQRNEGTLVAHYRHRMTTDVLAMPGLLDVTAHVNFTAVAEAARGAGGLVSGYTSQAAFLLDCGLLDLMRGDPSDVARWAPQAAALQRLLSEAEMGELFKVILIRKKRRDVVGFRRSDRSEALLAIRDSASLR